MTQHSPKERTGGEALADQLIEEGVTDIFGIPGIQLDWAVEAIRARADRLRFIVPRHEQATSYMADGYARTTGREAVCMVVPGPGMLNALSGISTAYACNARVLFLVGQTPSDTIGKGLGMLHELPDQSGIVQRLVKWHAIAEKAEDIPRLVNEAFASSARVARARSRWSSPPISCRRPACAACSRPRPTRRPCPTPRRSARRPPCSPARRAP